MRDIVREAFLTVSEDNSADVVLADPQLNSRFLAACRKRGLSTSDLSLNQCLLNLRKMRGLQGIRKSKRAQVGNQEEYRFASEIAARFLERKYQISLDQVLCDPVRVAQFDEVASRISPGFTPFQYRW